MIAEQPTHELEFSEFENSASENSVAGNRLQKEVVRFLHDLLKAQQNFLTLQQARQAALTRANWELIKRLDQQEVGCQQALQQLLNRRKSLLQQFQAEGVSGETLQQVCRNLGWDRETELGKLLKETRDQAEQLKQTSWSIWVLSQRAGRHYAQLLNLITHGLKPAPCYQQHENSAFETGGGGALLDASI